MIEKLFLYTEIFRIENMDMVPITDDKICGRFFGGDSYVIRYSYKNSEGRDAYIVYFWQVILKNYLVEYFLYLTHM